MPLEKSTSGYGPILDRASLIVHPREMRNYVFRPTKVLDRRHGDDVIGLMDQLVHDTHRVDPNGNYGSDMLNNVGDLWIRFPNHPVFRLDRGSWTWLILNAEDFSGNDGHYAVINENDQWHPDDNVIFKRNSAAYSKPNFQIVGSGGPSLIGPEEYPILENVPQVKVVRREAGVQFDLWMDGVLLDSETDTWTPSFPINAPLYLINSDQNNFDALRGFFYLFVIWEEALSDEEIRQVSRDVLARSFARGWQFPEGYEDHVSSVLPPDPDPDPGFGVLSGAQDYYRIPSVLLSHQPPYFTIDPYLREFARVAGREFSMLRTSVDRVLHNLFYNYADAGWALKKYVAQTGENLAVGGTEDPHQGVVLNTLRGGKFTTLKELVEAWELLVPGAYGRVWPIVNFNQSTVDIWAGYDVNGSGGLTEAQQAWIEQSLPVRLSVANYFEESPNPSMAYWRFRNDDGDETTATWKAAELTPASIPTDEVFRARIQLADLRDYTVGAAMLWNDWWGLQYQIVPSDGSPRSEWKLITESDALVRLGSSANFATGVDTTPQLTVPGGRTHITPNGALIDSADPDGLWSGFGFAADPDVEYVELEPALIMDTTKSPESVVTGDMVYLRVVRRIQTQGGVYLYRALQARYDGDEQGSVWGVNEIPGMPFFIVA